MKVDGRITSCGSHGQTRLALGPPLDRQWGKDSNDPRPLPPLLSTGERGGVRGRQASTESSPMQETILQSVGRTPLVQLRRLGQELEARIYTKLESLNPGGSVKDHVGVAMTPQPQRRGWLRPAGTTSQPTARNTGAGLAIAAARTR